MIQNKQKCLFSRNSTFLESDFLLDRKYGIIELNEVREEPIPQIVGSMPQQPIKEV